MNSRDLLGPTLTSGKLRLADNPSMPRHLEIAAKATEPLELIKDRSLLRVRAMSAVLILGHLFYYWVWTYFYPQPYESLSIRMPAILGSVVLLILTCRMDAEDGPVILIYSLLVFYGTSFVATWFYVANNGNVVWLSSYSVLLMLYFGLTDWRIASIGSLASVVLVTGIMPHTHPEIWKQVDAYKFMGPALFVVAFALGTTFLNRILDENVRKIQMNSLRRALGIAAHEIRTPLAGINLLSGAILMRLADMKPGQRLTTSDLKDLVELSAQIERNVSITLNVISSNLTNATVASPFSVQLPVEIWMAIEESKKAFEALENDRRGVIDAIQRANFTIACDPVVVQQILRNLIDNSYTAVLKKYGRAPEKSIVIAADIQNGRGLLIVKDSGVGIKRSEIGKIFEPFHTTSEGSGHGLGLTFVKSALKAYNGNVQVSSERDVGTVVSIDFPLV